MRVLDAIYSYTFYKVNVVVVLSISVIMSMKRLCVSCKRCNTPYKITKMKKCTIYVKNN